MLESRKINFMISNFTLTVRLCMTSSTLSSDCINLSCNKIRISNWWWEEEWSARQYKQYKHTTYSLFLFILKVHGLITLTCMRGTSNHFFFSFFFLPSKPDVILSSIIWHGHHFQRLQMFGHFLKILHSIKTLHK